MSVISANTLFHFTKTKEVLINILKTGFRPAYSKEFGNSVDDEMKTYEIPMVSFCDLPMSSLYKHIGFDSSDGYGKYGLGMSKEWGKAKLLNPVNYFTKESHVLRESLIATDKLFHIRDYYRNKFYELMQKYEGIFPEDYSEQEKIIVITMDSAKLAFNANLTLQNYLKPYEDNITKVKYYDEREWRYIIPTTDDLSLQVSMIAVDHPEYIKIKEFYKSRIEQFYMLKFKAEDIKYLIVENSNDVNDIIEALESMDDIYTDSDRNRIIGRIITCDQIQEDF